MKAPIIIAAALALLLPGVAHAIDCKAEKQRMDKEAKALVEDSEGLKVIYAAYRGPDRESWAQNQLGWIKDRQEKFRRDTEVYKQACVR